MTCGASHIPASRRGSVLIIVLWIAFGLISVTLLFGHSMLMEYQGAENSVASLEADQAVDAARRYYAFLLANLEEAGRLPDETEYEVEAVAVGDAMFWAIGRDAANPENSEAVTFGLLDESAKLNLNTATREMLEALPDMTAELAAAIVDWRDTDTEVSPDGAESQTYLLLDEPYNCKDGEFETVEELRLVAGADMELLLGEDTNRNGYLDANENDGDESDPPDDGDGQLDYGLWEYLTVSSREPNKRSDGTERVNLKTDNEGLSDLLNETFGDERGREITQATGSTQNINSVLEYGLRAKLTADEWPQIEDALTVSDESFQRGLINVNVAPAAVLACLPGLDESLAEQLVTYRQDKGDELDSLYWVSQALEEEAAVQAGPYLTTRTYQWTADVMAQGRNGRGFRRVRFILDTTEAIGGEGSVKVIFRRDESRQGCPLDAETRAQALSQTSENESSS